MVMELDGFPCLAIRSSLLGLVTRSFVALRALALGAPLHRDSSVSIATPLSPGRPKRVAESLCYYDNAIALPVPRNSDLGETKRSHSGQRCCPLGASHSDWETTHVGGFGENFRNRSAFNRTALWSRHEAA